MDFRNLSEAEELALDEKEDEFPITVGRRPDPSCLRARSDKEDASNLVELPNDEEQRSNLLGLRTPRDVQKNKVKVS